MLAPFIVILVMFQHYSQSIMAAEYSLIAGFGALVWSFGTGVTTSRSSLSRSGLSCWLGCLESRRRFLLRREQIDGIVTDRRYKKDSRVVTTGVSGTISSRCAAGVMPQLARSLRRSLWASDPRRSWTGIAAGIVCGIRTAIDAPRLLHPEQQRHAGDDQRHAERLA